MKENIEDDIRNAEHFISSVNNDKSYKEDGWHGYDNTEIVELARMLEHILSEYKRLQKENEELREYYEEQNEVNAKFIPVQKIKNKIKRLQYELKHIACQNSNCNKCFSEYRGSNFTYCYAYYQIKVLKELL